MADEALPQVARVRSARTGPAVSPGPPLTDVGYLLNKATRHLRLRLAEALAGTGLTPQQAAVLLAIGRSIDGRLTPRTIAESVDTDQATTSGLLERLTRDGWLRSEPHPDDGRSRLIGLTEKAEQALPAVLPAQTDAGLAGIDSEPLGHGFTLAISQPCRAPTTDAVEEGKALGPLEVGDR